MTDLSVEWLGPFALVAENECGGLVRVKLPEYVRNEPGVYLWAIRAGGQYLLHDVGQSKSLRSWVQHDRGCLLNGRYYLHDSAKLKAGTVCPIYNPNREDDQARLARDAGLQAQLQEYVALLEVFVGYVPEGHRLRHRVETRLARYLAQESGEPHVLYGDWKDADLIGDGDQPVRVTFASHVPISGMPSQLQV